MRIAVIGGDERALSLYERLRREGVDCVSLGLTKAETGHGALTTANVALLPYPFSVRGGQIRGLTDTLAAYDVLRSLPLSAFLIAGEGLIAEGRHVLHYADSEDFLEQNAILSAEGTVFALMRDRRRAIYDMNIAVTGYGRLARAAAIRLRALGAEVCVYARSPIQRQRAMDDGMEAHDYFFLPELIDKADCLINTVPAPVIDAEGASRLRQDARILEIASLPGGFTKEARELLGERVTCLGAIPAWYAPRSAGDALYQAAMTLLDKEGIR